MATAKKLDRSGFKLPPKPPAAHVVDEVRAAAFIGATDAPPIAPSTTPAARKATKLRAAERGERLTIYLPPSVARALRMRCADENRSASDAVAAALRAWLGA